MLIASLLIIFAITYLVTQQALTPVITSWNNYEKQALQKEALLSSMKTHMGYNGLIEHFNAFILTNRSSDKRATEQSFEALQTAIADYKTADNLNLNEQQALSDLLVVANAYYQQLKIIEDGHKNQRAPSDIYDAININDQQAINALETLAQYFKHETQKERDYIYYLIQKPR